MSAVLRVLKSTLFVFLPMVMVSSVSAQGYPTRPIRMLSPVPGGMADIAGRLIAQGVSAPLGQPVIVDNRPGVISVETAAKSAPDGYTLLMTAQSMWTSPLLGTKVSYNSAADFAPVTWAVAQHNILMVHPSVPANSVKELIALAKAKPGALNYASGPDGGGPHVSGELFKSMAGVNMTRVPYKGTAQALVDLLSGSVQVMFAPAANLTHAKSGKLKALAVTSAKPSVLAPGLPALAESLPGYQAGGMAAIFVPAGTPAPIVERLNKEIVRALNVPETKEKLLNSGIETIGSSPRELAAAVKADMARMSKLIKEAGIRGGE